jgi:hypothetical protein
LGVNAEHRVYIINGGVSARNDIVVTMKKLHVFSYRDRAQAALIQEILVNEGIHCLLRNDQLSSALGEIPFIECYPELWVVDNDVGAVLDN